MGRHPDNREPFGRPWVLVLGFILLLAGIVLAAHSLETSIAGLSFICLALLAVPYSLARNDRWTAMQDKIMAIWWAGGELGIPIPEDEAEWIETVGDLKRYIEKRAALARGLDPVRCVTQHLFYRLRRAIRRALPAARSRLRPGTPWKRILPEVGRYRAWDAIGVCFGRGLLPPLERNVHGQLPVEECPTLGASANRAAFFRSGGLEESGEPWSREEISEAVDGVLRDLFHAKDFTDGMRLVDVVG